MRKPLVLALLLLAAFQAGGWLLAWASLWFDARAAAYRAVSSPETTLVHCVLHRDAFVKARVERREVRLDGALFDIQQLAIRGDSVHLTLYHDWQEERLLNTLASLLGAQSDPEQGAPLADWLASVLGAVFLLPEPPGWPQQPTERPAPQRLLPLAAVLRPQHTPGLPAPPPWA